MRTFLIAAPGESREAARYGAPLAHMAYHIGSQSTLLRQNLPLQNRGGLLCISDREAPAVLSPEELCAAAVRECSRREYSGVLLDFDQPPRKDLREFARLLEERLRRRKQTLYLPETYARDIPAASVLIGTALSGGNYPERLREAAAQYGGFHRLALDAERLRMDFLLPCPSGMGTPLSAEAFQVLLEEKHPAVFFSPDLCARYFTYTQEGDLHFVLFDDAGTLREKLRLGAELGIPAAFLSWPEVADLAAELFQHSLP